MQTVKCRGVTELVGTQPKTVRSKTLRDAHTKSPLHTHYEERSTSVEKGVSNFLESPKHCRVYMYCLQNIVSDYRVQCIRCRDAQFPKICVGVGVLNCRTNEYFYITIIRFP